MLSLFLVCDQDCVESVQGEAVPWFPFFFFFFFSSQFISICFIFPFLLTRPVSRFLCSCCRGFSGCTTAAGSHPPRRRQWRAASKSSLTWVRMAVSASDSCKQPGAVVNLSVLRPYNLFTNSFHHTQPKVGQLPFRLTWTARWTTCLWKLTTLYRRPSWIGGCRLGTPPDETPRSARLKITETSLRGCRYARTLKRQTLQANLRRKITDDILIRINICVQYKICLSVFSPPYFPCHHS